MSDRSQDIAYEDTLPAWIKYDRIIVHVGLHKTGTTFCQRSLFPQIEGAVLAYEVAETHAVFLIPEIEDGTNPDAAPKIRVAIERAAGEGRPVIISDEALGGLPFHQKYHRGVAAQRIKAVFPNAKILLTIREQRAVIGSLYGQYLRYGYCSSLAEFLAQDGPNPAIAPVLDLNFYNYHRAARFYEGVFGAGNVAAVPMEQLLADPGGFVARLSALAGAEMHLPAEFDTGTRELPAWSKWARSYQRLANRFIPQDSRTLRKPSRFSPGSVANKIDQFTPGWARRRGKRRMAQAIDAALGAHFAASNRSFSEAYGVDLAALGYR